MMVSFRLLGNVALHDNDQALIHFRSQKEAALLIYLA
jgi:DNA-binding SARP family transcriptional activator